MNVPLGRLIIYTKKIDEMADFYVAHFGYSSHKLDGDRIVELIPTGVGCAIMLHPASMGQKQGQSLVKLVFDIADVRAFSVQAKIKGLNFGPIHEANGYCFANAKDPSNNSISISSRVFSVPQK